MTLRQLSLRLSETKEIITLKKSNNNLILLINLTNTSKTKIKCNFKTNYTNSYSQKSTIPIRNVNTLWSRNLLVNYLQKYNQKQRVATLVYLWYNLAHNSVRKQTVYLTTIAQSSGSTPLRRYEPTVATKTATRATRFRSKYFWRSCVVSWEFLLYSKEF